ncbi:MAG: type III pantothenate kinase [Synergistaceae bacterium]|jgi:type III pantothenate kinase|nr:type III pantothenate kinase [Synergistaceae bacterium]
MLIVLDIGNTTIVTGLFDGDRLTGHWRFSSYDRTSDEAGLMMINLLASNGVTRADIKGAILSSVVPRLEEVWRDAIGNYLGVTPLIVTSELDLGIRIDMDNPREVGADRLVNAVAAVSLCGYPVVSVDLGTTINLDVVSRDGDYIGGAIAPGLEVSMQTLFSKAAKLPQIALASPGMAIGRNTMKAVQSGIVYGFVGLVDSLVERIFAELGARTPVIATGGHAEILAADSKTVTRLEPWLTLEGLRIIYRRVSGVE